MKKIGTVIIFLFMIIIGGFPVLRGQEDRPEKIAIASDGDTIESQVGSQGARCPWFLFFDANGQLLETLENPYWQERGGAGINCAELLAEKGVTIFVAGNVGHKMSAALESSGIASISFSGTVEDALAKAMESIAGKH
ncbi:MAG: NifB/NifX family molybdenum-iron cluster-binding protein [Candidatus Aminicenantes bacterium]|nr:NifB/NifX family molybdenum-iron cluster-binding protein [Candidatus Aminicenantes bacterium]